MPPAECAPNVFFLAAGQGTRLAPLTLERPKPLVPVGGTPQLLRLARRFSRSHLVANAHYLGAQLVEAAAQWRATEGVSLAVHHEPPDLGTAGGFAAARRLFRPGAALLHNADIVLPRGVVEASLGHAVRAGEGALLCGPALPAGQGNVGLGAANQVVRLRQGTRPSAHETHSANYWGVSVWSEAQLRALPPRGCLVQDAWLPWIAAGGALRAVCHARAADFLDLGTPSEYLRANLHWLRGRGLRARALPGATLPGCAREVIAGAGAVIGRGVERVVAWPGAVVADGTRDAVVTTARVWHVAP